MGTTTRTVTYEEWLNMPVVDDAIEEVVNGEIRIMPPNKWKHAIILENLSDALKAQVDRKAVRVVASVFGLIIRKTPLTSWAPELAVFIKQNIVEQDGYIHSAPELVVEVLSLANTRRLMNEKISDYQSIASSAWADDLDSQVKRLVSAYALVEQNAADPVSSEQVFYQGVIPGMLRRLDPHSVFFDPQQFEQLKQLETSTRKGFGSVVSVLP